MTWLALGAMVAAALVVGSVGLPVVAEQMVGSERDEGARLAAAAITVSECGGALLAVSRQNSPGMAFTHPEQLGGLGYR